MANHSATKKSIRQSAVRTERNRAGRSRIRTYITKVRTLTAEGKKDDARAFFPEAQSVIMRGVTKGLLKKNTASRIVSRLNKNIKAL